MKLYCSTNRSTKCRAVIFIAGLSWLHYSVVVAAPENPKTFRAPVNGGLLEIPDGSIVEGSYSNGGIQPDYIINYNDPHLKPLRRAARKLKSEPDRLKRIEKLREIIHNSFSYTNYRNPKYLGVSKKYRELKTNVPLGKYVECSASVCREHGLLAHILLQDAGIKNRFAYAKIHRSSVTDQYNIVEDHAFTVFRYKNEDWVFDPYYWGFNGYRLTDLESKRGITKKSPTLRFAEKGPGFRRIIRINDYPKVWKPLAGKKTTCLSRLFSL